jgi:plastocyanin
VTTDKLQRTYFAPITGNEPSKQASFESMRLEAVQANSVHMPQQFAIVLALSAALLIAAVLGTANAQDLSGSWKKVRQGCQTGQVPCQIKAKIDVQNLSGVVSPASTLQIYLSNNMTFGGGDTLLHTIAVGPINPGATVPFKMAFDLAFEISASGSFLIAVLPGNNIAVFANPGPTGIVLFDKLFGPDEVTILAGTRVRWMHRDEGQDHTVTSGACPNGNCSSDGLFTSGNDPDFMVHLDEYLLVFDNAGVFPYYCEKHEADMTGTIIVIN